MTALPTGTKVCVPSTGRYAAPGGLADPEQPRYQHVAKAVSQTQRYCLGRPVQLGSRVRGAMATCVFPDRHRKEAVVAILELVLFSE